MNIESVFFSFQLAEGLLGQATILYLKEDMSEAKKFLIRARELATDVLGPRHHYVAAIINKVRPCRNLHFKFFTADTYLLQKSTIHISQKEYYIE